MLKIDFLLTNTNKLTKNPSKILWVLAPTLFVLFTSFYKNGDGLTIGDSIPSSDIEMETASGDTTNLSSLSKENGLIVIFSCNTCPFVVGSGDFTGWESQYNDIYDTANKDSIGVVLINSNSAKRDGVDSKEKMSEHAKEENYKIPYLVDEGSIVANAFGAKTTPHVFVFNGNNTLIYKGSIDNTWDTKRKKDHSYLMNVIKKIVAGKEIKNNSTPPKGCSIKRKKIN